MIIHIAGSTGSGKTFIGEMFKNSFNVIDLDNWTEEYQNKTNKSTLKKNKKSFINFIQLKINKLSKTKINLLVGYIDVEIKGKVIVFPIDTIYKIFIDVTPDILFNQYNTRLVNYVCSNKDKLIKLINLQNNNLPKFKSIEELNKILNDDIELYVNTMRYILMTQDKIIDMLNKIQKNKINL